MFKSILSISILAACGMLIFALLLPNQANYLAREVLGKAVTVDMARLVNPTGLLSDEISSIMGGNSASATTDVQDNSPLSAVNIIDATNAERVKAGLPPLKTNDALAQSAKLKVEDMINNQYFDHTSPSGKTVADLGDEVGYNYVVMGENLALGDFKTADDLLQAWMNSPGHKANILNKSYEDMGAYAAQGMYQGHMVWFAVQHFGTERGVCPALDAELKGSIDALNADLKKQETAIEALRVQIEAPDHADGAAYSALITRFNTMVSAYNAGLATSQQEIGVYNKQVVAFNNCLGQYQAAKE